MKELIKRALPVCTALFALVWLYVGLTVYGFWDAKRGPLGGFFPVLVAGLLFLASVAALLQSNREKAPVFHRDSLMLIAAAFLIFAGCFVIGMVPSLVVFLVVWLRWIEKYSWRMTLSVSAAIFAVVTGVFILWLGVRFPTGMVMEWVRGAGA